jgi:hypothetical protein
MKPRQFFEVLATAAMGNGLPDQRFDFAKERGDRRIIVVAAAPKSGSTFLVNTLIKSTQLTGFRLTAGYSTNEHDLYLPALCLANKTGCVSQLHMKGTFHNAALMKRFAIKPVVLVRNIYDIVVSLQHDLREKAQLSALGTGKRGYSFLWQDQSTKGLGDDRLRDMIIDLAVPWFVNFYVSWQRLCEQGAVDAHWVTYEQLFSDKAGTLRQILDFLGLPEVAIDPKLLDLEYETFRDGRSGHGVSVLSPGQQARIRQQFSYYPDIDFGKYGL